MAEQAPGASRPWDDPQWLGETDAWIAAQLARVGLAVTGPGEIRGRPWSVVRTLPTADGPVHFKATHGLSNDAAITARLAPLSPLLLQPIAADPDRGWLLMPDGGQRLRDARRGDGWIAVWREALPAYAALQLAAVPSVAALTPATFDYRPNRLPAALEGLLADEAVLRRGRPEGITDGELAVLRRLAPVLAEVCAELSAAGLPETVQHDDLHDGNILVGDAVRVIDWGDTAVAHPLGTLLVTLDSVADHLDLPVEAPEVAALRDAYLEPFSTLVPMARLRALVPLARWTAMVGRASTWRAVLSRTRNPEEEGLAYGDTAWLRELLVEAPVRG